MDNSIYYVNFESWELLTMEQLKEYFETSKEEEQRDYNFKEYLNNCMSYNNGSLERVERITKEDIKHMLRDGLITQETANTLLNLEIYATNRPSFYTADGRYFYNYDDLNTIND